ncbi:MAG: radical SAM/SPASM domain-containing protein [Armatimonadota bacterium]
MQIQALEQRARQADRYEAVLDRARRQCIPVTMLWELTCRCNLRCAHCYVSRGAAEAELDTREALTVLDQLAEAGTLYLILSGGEPLLRDDFFTIAEAARQREFAVRIFTNGTKVNEEAAGRIADLAPLSVEVSLYGHRAATHDAISGVPGSHQQAIRALELLRERGVYTVAKTTVMRSNLAEFDQMRDWAEQHADRFLYNLLVMPGRDGDGGPLATRLTRDELRQFYDGRIGAWEPDTPEVPLDASLCLAGFSIGAIGPSGTVYPCVALPLAAGELRQESFASIWNNSPILTKIRRLTLADTVCRTCEDLGICSRCPALALLEDGELVGRAHGACAVAEAKREALDYSRKDEGIAGDVPKEHRDEI